MAAKKIEIIYDINGKPIDVAIDKTLNLQQQVRQLTAELRRTKEGTAEFTILSSKLNDAKDNLERVNVKSRDLFASLSLLPGPVGDFFGKLNGVIGLMKTFSGFSVKDLKNQFKELGNDLKDIYENIKNFGASKTEIDVVTDSASNLSDGLNNATTAAAGANKELRGTGVNLIGVKSGMKLAEDAVKNLSKSFNGQVDVLTNAKGKITDIVVSYTDANGEIKLLTENQVRNIAVSKTQITTTQQLAAAEVEATVATSLFAKAVNGLKVAFISLAAATGIGLLLVGLGYLIELLADGFKYLIKFWNGTLAAEKATKELAKSLEDLDIAYEKSNKSLKRTTDERIALLKSQGATEEEIRKDTIDALKKDRDLTSKTLGETIDILKKLNKNRGKNDEENNKQIEIALKKKRDLEEKYKDQSSAIRVAEYNNITENNKKIAEANKQRADENKIYYLQLQQVHILM